MKTASRNFPVILMTLSVCSFVLCLQFSAAAAAADEPPAGVTVARQLAESLNWAAERVKPAVVTVQRLQHSGSVCSGFVIDPDGLILTSYEFIKGDAAVMVRIPGDKDRHNGKIVAFDVEQNVALIRIGKKQLHAATLGDSDALRFGEWVLTVGVPSGLTNTVIMGIISDVNKKPGVRADTIFSETHMARGTIGGPLVNLDGEIVGMVLGWRDSSYQGVAASVPGNILKQLVTKWKAAVVKP